VELLHQIAHFQHWVHAPTSDAEVKR
jgi:hypothetical protein